MDGSGGERVFYRVVSVPEWEDIEVFGGFRIGPNTLEGKLFATRLEDARWWAARLYLDVAFHIVEVTLPTGSEVPIHPFNADGRPAAYVDDSRLSSFNKQVRIRLVE